MLCVCVFIMCMYACGGVRLSPCLRGCNQVCVVLFCVCVCVFVFIMCVCMRAVGCDCLPAYEDVIRCVCVFLLLLCVCVFSLCVYVCVRWGATVSLLTRM